MYFIARNKEVFGHDIVELDLKIEECRKIVKGDMSLQMFDHKGKIFYLNERMQRICKFDIQIKSRTQEKLKIKFFFLQK